MTAPSHRWAMHYLGRLAETAGGGPLRVALINDYELVVGLARLLEPYRHRVALIEFDINTPVARPVDVALYDTFAQDQGDRASIDEILAGGRVGRVVMYRWNVHDELIQAALTRGASGYVSKGTSAEDLVHALERVHRGERVADRSETPSVVPGDWPGRQCGLSAREAEVVALITQGLRNDEIAQRSYLSINSVKTYIRSAYRKIGVTRRPEAILWGIRNGLQPDLMRRPGPDANQGGVHRDRAVVGVGQADQDRAS